MEWRQLQYTLLVISCAHVMSVCCKAEESGSHLQELSISENQKRAVEDVLTPEKRPYLPIYQPTSDNPKRVSLLRFGKRRTLLRFGRRGSLFRFGKRGSLLRFGRRGSLLRFGRREEDTDRPLLEEDTFYAPDDNMKRTAPTFHWGRQQVHDNRDM